MKNVNETLTLIDGTKVRVGELISYDEEKKEVNFNGDVFIIPNHATRVKDSYFPEKLIKKGTAMCEANNDTFDVSNDWFVECWVTSGCSNGFGDNFCDHSYRFEQNGKVYRFGGLSRNILKRYINGKEGEVVNFKMPHYIVSFNGEDEEKIEVTIKASLRLKQKGYRYARFGNFEDVLVDVCN